VCYNVCMIKDRELHRLFHTLWTKAVGTDRYNKEEWKRLEEIISNLQIKVEETKPSRSPSRS
jgi:hypothetical protein